MIKRYSQWCAVTHGHQMGEKPDGAWVLFEDYNRLATALREIERLGKLHPDPYVAGISFQEIATAALTSDGGAES
jgi:hypothetical protein